jgi:hypothetical protein
MLDLHRPELTSKSRKLEPGVNVEFEEILDTRSLETFKRYKSVLNQKRKRNALAHGHISFCSSEIDILCSLAIENIDFPKYLAGSFINLTGKNEIDLQREYQDDIFFVSSSCLISKADKELDAQEAYKVKKLHSMQWIFSQKKPVDKKSLQQEFNRLATRWKSDTESLSSIKKKITHPDYLKIIEMGYEVVPIILQSLLKEPDHWFVALNKISGEDPISYGASFQEAVIGWLQWGQRKGFFLN